MFRFKIKNIHKKSRTGFFDTPHGKIKTPNIATVATHGKIKLLTKTDHSRVNPDLTIANTFHLFVNNKVKEIKKAGGLHKWSGFKKPIMTDSGGFQVFSLGWGRAHGTGKVGKIENFFEASRKFDVQKFANNKNPVKISEKGVVFNYDNKKYDFTPEKSIKIQEDLGADVIFAFDECTSPLHDHFYTKKSMEQTHRWAVRSLNAHKKKNQALFGIVQGGVFEDLRKKSSKFIGGLPFDGFGIGGSFGEKQMKDVLRWSLSGLPEEKPRHLLGIGKIKDIFIAVKEGIDLFDCVIPTREARHGILYVKSGKFAIEKGIFAGDKKLIDGNCGCFVCRNKITRKELHCYFKSARKADNKKLSTCDVDRLVLGKRLATIHNIHFFKNLFGEIREAIADGKLDKLEREYLF
ncbi:MAG: tRNA guanosine(34) transglycosylase Tgt [Patescibacteria group bacterium]